MAFLTLNASASGGNTLAPKILNSTPPVIDGVHESLWDGQNSTYFTLFSTNILKVYTCMVGTYIYFALEYKISTHDKNESFAIACSNAAPSNSSFNNSILSYPVVKVVRIDGKSWDQQIVKDSYPNNWSEGNSITFAERNESSLDNASFYEIKLACSLPRAHGQDINWTYSTSYKIRIFYGVSYTSPASAKYEPIYRSWTTSTPEITLTFPPDPQKPNPNFTPVDLNTLVAEIVFFVITGVILGMVGFYILQTKQRIKKV